MKLTKLIMSGAATVVIGLTGALLPVSAHAASPQRICSSKYSDYYSVYVNGNSIAPGACVTVPRGTQVKLDGKSHKVGYDKKPYSACRTSPTGYFTPYQGADIIYFQSYILKDCRGIGIAGRVGDDPADFTSPELQPER